MALADTIRGMGKFRIAALILVPLIMMGFFAVLAMHMSTGNMAPLFTNLALEDSSKIIAELEKSNTPYELVAGGTQILVPSDRVLRLRMSMAEQNLPSGGSVVGYEIFDRSETFGSSNFVMNINALRALEGELSRTIASLAGVDSARVHVVMPSHELFSREREKPSASVTVKMRGGQSLDHAEVGAISHLVAAAVPSLEASHVTIVDNHGHLLARGDGEGMEAATAQEARVAYETRMQQTLEDLIEKVVGSGKVRVQVAADMNFDHVVTNSETFDPNGQVARSTQSTSEKETGKEKGAADAVTVGNNLPKAQAGDNGGGTSSDHATDHTEDTTNYEISKTTQNHVQEGGNVNKLSVAVLVDGNYTPAADPKEPAAYAPRSAEELAQIKTLIASAIGFDEKRGDKVEVVNMRFTQDLTSTEASSILDKLKIELQPILQTLIIAVVAILAILLVLRPAVMQLIKQMQVAQAQETASMAALEAPDGANPARLTSAGGTALEHASGEGMDADMLVDVANIKGGMKSSTMKQVNDIVDKYPEETMGVLRQWLMAPSPVPAR